MKGRRLFLSLNLITFIFFTGCESNEGKVVNGNGTLSVGLTYFKDQTTSSAARIHYFIQNLDLTTYEEVEELQEDRVIEKGVTLDTLTVETSLLEGFSPAGLSMAKDQDGSDAVNVYYNRNKVTVTFNLLKGKNSKWESKSSISGIYGAPLDVKNDVDLGKSYFLDHDFGPKTFPPTDTTYDLNVATIENYIRETEIEGGTFVRNINGVERTVTVDNFAIAAIELPQYLYTQMGFENGSHFQGSLRIPVEGENQDFRPVENLSWYDCLVICNEMSKIDGFLPVYAIDGETDPKKWGTVPEDSDSENLEKWNSVTMQKNANGYRLPTEAEWEYAARGGNLSQSKTVSGEKDFVFAGSNSMQDVAWNVENSSACTHEVGLLSPNELGLYDMSGNVGEWCWDIYGDYPEKNVENPLGAESGGYRVKRGGTYYSASDTPLENSSNSVFSRNQNIPYRRTSGFGLRLARSLMPVGAIE